MTVKKLYVVGSGAMGSGIAQTAATHGIQVIMNVSPKATIRSRRAWKRPLQRAE